jgi:tryptophan-rich sensory protein
LKFLAASSWIAYACAGLGSVVILYVGYLVTELSPWYYNLKKPSWQPPDWLFGPAWTTIFILTTWAIGLGWNLGPGHFARQAIVALFVANGVLNVVWSLLFFKLRRPDWALIEVPLLWLTVLGLMAVLGGLASSAAWLLLPHLLWVTFAAYLNRTIIRLNGSFA